MNERVKSANKVIMSSKEILARASKLLTDSAHKSSNIRNVEINGQRDHLLKKDHQHRDPKKKHRKPDPKAGPEDYGLYFPDLYRVQGSRNEGIEDSFAKQPASAIDGGRLPFPNFQLGDDSVVSMPSMRLNNGMAYYNERTLDSGDNWDQEVNTRVLLTYFLHALEIERLVFVNKEMVDDAKEIDKELEEADKEINRLKAEKRRVEKDRDEYKFRWQEASKLIKDDKQRHDAVFLGDLMKTNWTSGGNSNDAIGTLNRKSEIKPIPNGLGHSSEERDVIIYKEHSSNQYQTPKPLHDFHEINGRNQLENRSPHLPTQAETNQYQWGSSSKPITEEKIDKLRSLHIHHLNSELNSRPSDRNNHLLSKPVDTSYTSAIKPADRLQQTARVPENFLSTEESKNF